MIVFVAPIMEEGFFRVLLLAFFLSTAWGRKSPGRAILAQAILFAFAHLGAYITGIYDYPNFAQGLSAFSANVSSFLVAGGFGFLAGFIVLENNFIKSRNILISIILHMGMNLIILGAFSIIT